MYTVSVTDTSGTGTTSYHYGFLTKSGALTWAARAAGKSRTATVHPAINEAHTAGLKVGRRLAAASKGN